MLATSLGALNIGERYDFICTDGQDIYNAELVLEDAERYFVRLSPVMSRVPIEKKYVTRTVSRSVAVVPTPRRVLTVGAGGGVDFATSKLSSFAVYAPGFFVSAAYPFLSQLNAVVRADFTQFTKGSSYLRTINLYAGAEFAIPYTIARISLSVGFVGGVAYLKANSETFADSAWVPSALVWTRFFYQMAAQVDLFIAPGCRYIYDRETLLLLPGVSLGVNYRLFGT